jgi:hypothetical protein
MEHSAKEAKKKAFELLERVLAADEESTEKNWKP